MTLFMDRGVTILYIPAVFRSAKAEQAACSVTPFRRKSPPAATNLSIVDAANNSDLGVVDSRLVNARGL